MNKTATTSSNKSRYIVGALATCVVITIGYYAQEKMNPKPVDPLTLHSMSEITEKEASALFFTGNDYYQQGNYGQAIELFTKAIDLNPKLAAAYSNRGLAFEKVENFAAAHADYAKTAELEPTNAQAHFLAGRALYSQQDFDGATCCFAQATKCAPGDAGLAGAIEELQISRLL